MSSTCCKLETREKIRQTLMGHTVSEETREKICRACTGNRHTEATRLKMSQTHTGMKLSQEHKDNCSISKMGDKNPAWQGGVRHHRHDGYHYIALLRPDHPYSNSRGYIFEHRLVVEAQIGRYLQPYEPVHHVNKVTTDNRPENLMAFVSNSAHIRFEKGGYVRPEEIIYDGRVTCITTSTI